MRHEHHPPRNFLMALANPSMASTSRWFVGSSKSRRFGFRMLIIANTILDFCPSDRHPMAVFCIFV